MNNRIAAWCLSGVQQDTWRIHSTHTFPQSNTITAVDCKSGKYSSRFQSKSSFHLGLLAVGSLLGLSVHTLILENDLPTWSQKWTVSYVSVPRFLLFP